MDLATLINILRDQHTSAEDFWRKEVDIILTGRKCLACHDSHNIGHFEVGDVLNIKDIQLTDNGRIQILVGG